MADRETMTSGGTSEEPAAPLPPPSIGGESVERPKHAREDDDPRPDDEQITQNDGPPIRFAETTVVGSAEPLAVTTLEEAPPVAGAGSIAAGTPRGPTRVGD